MARVPRWFSAWVWSLGGWCCVSFSGCCGLGCWYNMHFCDSSECLGV